MSDKKPSTDSYALEKKISPPQRDVSVIISREGHYPQTLVFFKGERVRLYVTTTLHEGSCFSVPSKDIFLTVKRGEISEGVLFFNKSGIYRFNCPIGKITGKIVVLERTAVVRKRPDDSEISFIKEK